MTTAARPYISDRHLWSVASSEAGAIAVWPQTFNRLHFDIAKSSHLTANLPDGEQGKTFTQYPDLPTKGR